MVSVDRNTLISQIVSLNPQLKPDELHKLSEAQLQAKLSQCIVGNKQDKNVDSIKINNTNTSETPKMTTEEAQDNAIENIKNNAEQAQKLLEAQDNGDISKAYNFVKEKLNSELAKSNVAKVVHKQFETAEFLREAKQGTLTYKEYLRRKREDIFKTFPEIDSYNDKQKQMIKKGLDSLTEGQLNRLQNQLLALPKKDDKNYQNSVNSFKQNFIKESIDEKKILTTTKSEKEQKITQKTTQKVKQAYNPSDGDRLMTFEETYLLEQGVKFNKENIQKFNDSAAQYTFANNLHNRLQDIHNMLDNDITLVKGNNANGVDLKTLENGNKRLKTSIYQALSKLYGNDINKINKGLQDLTDEKYTFKLKNNDPKQGLTLDNLELVDSSIPEDSKFKPNTDMVLPSLAEKVLKGLDTNYSKALNGKKLEDYAKTMANDYKNAYGTKDATALASSFAQDQEDIVQTARNTVQIAGMGVMVGGMAFSLPVAFIGGLISSFGGIAVEAYNENTKENPNKEKNKELGQEVFVNAALFAIGAGSGKVGSMAKTALTAKNAPKLVAAMADIGVDSSLSLLGDLTLTGQIDLSGEGFSQLMSLVAGHKGKIVKGVQKGKQFLKEKFSAQANTNNKILQMPDGTVVEVRPDGSTVEVKADGEGAKAIKPEPKTENVKTETTIKRMISLFPEKPSSNKLDFFEYLESKKQNTQVTYSASEVEKNISRLHKNNPNNSLEALSATDNLLEYGIKSYKDLINSEVLTKNESKIVSDLYATASKYDLQEIYDNNLNLLINFANTVHLNKDNFTSFYHNLSKEQLQNIKYILEQAQKGNISPNEIYEISSRVCTEIPHEFYDALMEQPENLLKQIEVGKTITVGDKIIGDAEECKTWLEQTYYLKEFLKKQALPESMTVHRIDSYSPLDKLKIGDKQIVDLMKDKTQIKKVEEFFNNGDKDITFNNFVGTSLSDKNTESVFGAVPIHWNIKLLKGYQAAFLPATLPNELARFDEAEVLLQAGTKFKINNANYKNGSWYIDVTATLTDSE